MEKENKYREKLKKQILIELPTNQILLFHYREIKKFDSHELIFTDKKAKKRRFTRSVVKYVGGL